MKGAAVSADFTSVMAEKADKIPEVDCLMLINPATGDLEMVTPNYEDLSHLLTSIQ